MDKVSVSRAIRALDERGLVMRIRNKQDRRASDVSLTAEGQAIYAEVAPLALNYEKKLLEAFTDAERDQLMSLLDKLEAQLDEVGQAFDR